ncbi:MAG TPA: shikimate kinase [Acidobacteriota bacterium]|nr:shikimate kinase [Acidobacteriota bacterium]
MLKHVYLVGFMASGKSTVGPLLAARLNRPFHDLDDLIEKEQQMTITEIFALKGEAYFRKVESRLLAQTAQLPPSVIGLGGGTFCIDANRAVVAENGVSVWLRIPLELAQSRCARISTRPLARDPEQFKALFELRQPHYSHAQIWIDVERKSPELIAEEIMTKLKYGEKLNFPRL